MGSSAERTRFIEETRKLETYTTAPPNPPRDHSYLSSIYEDLGVKNTINYFPRFDYLPYEQRAVVTSYVFKNDRTALSGKVCTGTYHWLVKSWDGVNSTESIQGRYNHFMMVNWSNKYLLGLHHCNRFVRGTKVLVINGPFEGIHRVIVGHTSDFHMFQSKIIVKVLFADESIHPIDQKNLRMIDIHCYLPFALQFDPLNIPRPWNWGQTPSFWAHRYQEDDGGWNSYISSARDPQIRW